MGSLEFNPDLLRYTRKKPRFSTDHRVQQLTKFAIAIGARVVAGAHPSSEEATLDRLIQSWERKLAGIKTHAKLDEIEASMNDALGYVVRLDSLARNKMWATVLSMTIRAKSEKNYISRLNKPHGERV